MMKRIIFIIAVTFSLCACEKQERSHWFYNMWSGEYDITMTNNDTGEQEPHVAGISLEFSDDRSECVVQKGALLHAKAFILEVSGFLQNQHSLYLLLTLMSTTPKLSMPKLLILPLLI